MNRLIDDFKELAYPMATRAIRTMAQTFLATVGTATMLSEVNWLAIFSTVVLAGICSCCTSIILGMPETDVNENSK